MADAIVSAVAQRLTDMVVEQIREEVSMVRGVKKEVRNLSKELKNVRKLLDDAERKGCMSESIRGWLRRLENATYEMDDVLDEWNFALIKFRMQQADAPPQETKVCSFIPHSSCFDFKKIATRRDIALKIKHVKAQLDVILKEKNKYDFLENQRTDHSLERATTSFVEIDDIRGRDIDRDNLVSKIISHSFIPSQGDQLGSFHISSIVGTGGIGKTTLAQLVYNDRRVKDCFTLRIWICVSDSFDKAMIAREIIRKAGGSAPSTDSLDGLLELVQESISGKKFFLILDDVWNGDDAKWGSLKTSLKCRCVAGSRILVTTRSEIVAKDIGTNENEIHRLGQLSDDECWSLLSHVAFFGRSEGIEKGFVDIGRGIAQKCKGLPLAVKTLGSLLRFKNTMEEWKDILHSEMWRLERTKVNLFPYLLLSYNDLSPVQKRCFSYCAVFPKDHLVKVDDLIRKWMALGYLSSDGGNASELELRGREYFDSLANRCLFQNFQKNEDVIVNCKMHDVVHDFAQYLREEDLNNSEEAKGCKICSTLVSRVKVYRSVLLIGDKGSDLHVCDCLAPMRVLDCRRFRDISMEIEKFIHLRSLILQNGNVNENNIRTICMLYNLQSLALRDCGVREIPSEIGNLSQLRHLYLSKNEELKELPERIRDLHELRSLDVSHCGLKEIPSEIGNLSQLRHLDLSKNGGLKQLPKSISNLHELRSLDVNYCARYFEFPQGIDGLINLKHLLVPPVNWSQCPLKYPQGLAKLTSLQTLYEFHGGGDWNKLGLLNKLNRLSGSLLLRIKSVEDDDDIVEQALEVELKKKALLRELKIEFVNWMYKENKEEEMSIMRRRFDVMDALQPPPNLQSLIIRSYMGSRFPEWIASPSFHQLREISLESPSCLSLPHLGKLPCLEELWIYEFKKVELVGREFLGISSSSSSSSSSSIGFPKLKKLVFSSFPKWKEWEDITKEEEESATVSVMPSLIHLEIGDCRNLKKLPHRLLRKASSLQKLTIEYGCKLLDESYKKKGGPLNKFISHIPNVIFY